MGTITTGDAVPGELIPPSWGDAVRADLNMLNTSKPDNSDAVLKAGGVSNAMTGALQVGGDATADTPGVEAWVQGRVTSCNNTADSANLALRRNVSGAIVVGQTYVVFTRTAATIGTITVASATGVAYNTTSDPRTKTPPPPTRGIGDAADRVQQYGGAAWVGRHIDPATGEPETGADWDFLSSHDVEVIAPYAVTGERDGVDGDGNPVYQQVDFSSLVPLLTAALADALDRIDALEQAAA